MNKELRIKNKKIVLYIDTASNKEVQVALIIDGKEDTVIQALDKNKAQVVLPIIDLLLKKHRLKQTDICEVNVNVGPGSFTGLRVGVSIANALAYSLGIPINGQRPGTFVEPEY